MEFFITISLLQDHCYPALKGKFMANFATTTSRASTYDATLLAKIANKRKAIKNSLIESRTQDLYIARQAETSHRGVSFHVKYVWA